MKADAIIDAFGHDSGVFALMNTAWAWPIAESLHFIGLSMLLGTIGIVDLRLLGFAKAIDLLDLHRITRIGIVGFAINIVTGAAFFVSDPDQYLYNPAFQLKVACMLLAAANVVAFYSYVWPRIAGTVPAGGCPFSIPRMGTVPRGDSPHGANDVPLSAKLCATLSLAAWMGVIVFGRLITFYRPPEHWCFWCS